MVIIVAYEVTMISFQRKFMVVCVYLMCYDNPLSEAMAITSATAVHDKRYRYMNIHQYPQ